MLIRFVELQNIWCFWNVVFKYFYIFWNSNLVDLSQKQHNQIYLLRWKHFIKLFLLILIPNPKFLVLVATSSLNSITLKVLYKMEDLWILRSPSITINARIITCFNTLLRQISFPNEFAAKHLPMRNYDFFQSDIPCNSYRNNLT